MKKTITIVGLILACIMLIMHSASADFSGHLWNKYRVSLIRMLEPRFKGKSAGTNIHHTIFSVLTSPDEARWATNKRDLQDYFASHPIKWNSRFSYVSRTAGYKIPELYKKGVLACKKPKAFLAFKNAKVDHFNGQISYPWMEVGETLKSFVARAKTGKAPKIHFVVQERKGAMSINSPWGRSTKSLSKAGPFISRLTPSLVKKVYGKDDEEAFENEENVPENLAESTWLFRRRRRHRPPPKPTVIHVKSEKFKMDFRAQGLTGITLKPGAWFDVNFIRHNKKCLAPYIAPHKALSLIPKVAWVAFRPHIKLTLSKTEWVKVQTLWKNPTTLGMTVGGSLFRHRNYRKYVKNDEAAWNALSEEQQSFYSDDAMSAEHEDDVIFNVETHEKTLEDDVEEEQDEDQEDEVTFSEEDAETNEALLDSVSFGKKKVARIVHDDEEEILSPNEETLSESTWLFRRRRRRPPPPPPPPKKVYEKVYTVQFKSNSPFPEIIAVTSQKVQNL